MLQFDGKVLAEIMGKGQADMLEFLADPERVGRLDNVEVHPIIEQDRVCITRIGDDPRLYPVKHKARYEVVLRLTIEDKEYK